MSWAVFAISVDFNEKVHLTLFYFGRVCAVVLDPIVVPPGGAISLLRILKGLGLQQ